MGGIISKKKDAKKANNQPSTTQMRNSTNVDFDLPPLPKESRRWKLMPSKEQIREKFAADGTLVKNSDPGLLELRVMLEDQIAQPIIGRFAKEMQALDIFMCWIDTQEYKSISAPDFRQSKALHIYHKYIKVGAVLQFGGIDSVERDRIRDLINKSREDPAVIVPNLYDKCQQLCFLEIYGNIYRPFKKSPVYTELLQKLKMSYNHVRLQDFDYIKKLGEGGFGLVVHCRKKSTGKHYAMKIQTKAGLLECFADDPRRADFERQAFASCQHPFIINMEYAFQSETLAMMVLTLSTCGDLSMAQRRSEDGTLSEERVRFYAAEVVLALGYLHQMGLMYRDLKPNNILLNADGHIQLIDLGGVLDVDGKVLGKDMGTGVLAKLLVPQFSLQAQPVMDEDKEEENDPKAKKKKKKRKMSIMGTFGYMAPEMVILLTQVTGEKVGYTSAIDWWSLGATLFRLLCGFRPFSQDNLNSFIQMIPTINGRRAPAALPEYAMLFQKIPFPTTLSPDAVDIISKFLDVNDLSRLGSGPDGVKNVKSHPFFKSIDWALLEQKHLEPPFIPPAKPVDDTPGFESFEAMMQEYNKNDWLMQTIKADDQKYFENWNFTSPQTLRVEFGISNEMAQYDRNFKVRQLLGDTKVDLKSSGKGRAPSLVKPTTTDPNNRRSSV